VWRKRVIIPAIIIMMVAAQLMVVGKTDDGYPYRSTRFAQLVAESYREGKAGDPGRFFGWLDKGYRESPLRLLGESGEGINGLIGYEKQELANISDALKKAEAEIALGARLHKLVKAIIPKFSLDRGFEFYNTEKLGERQCFLQSVLIVGLLQDIGVSAGTVMVYKNNRGEETNNGHAVVLVKLSDGRDIIIDASEPQPFGHHQGLFVAVSDYRYVDPVYEEGSYKIREYLSASSREILATSKINPLDYDFIRSQFYYYRGERAVGGVLSKSKTKAGLQLSERYLRTSVTICPRNPLAVYMLGKVYLAEKSAKQAKDSFKQAHGLYSRFGWVPQGSQDSLSM